MSLRIFVFLYSIFCNNQAILFNGSCNFCNYRHDSNVRVLSHVLLKNGFSKDEIVLFSGENSIDDDRNIDKGYVHLSSTLKIPVPRIEVQESTVQDFLNAINCNHKKLVDCNKNSNVLVYMCGHGNEGFLKVQYREAILSYDLNSAIMKLADRVGKVLLIVDTCRSASFLPKSRFPKNVFVVATSLVSEPSISSFSNSQLGVHCIDNFPYYLHELTKNIKNMPLDSFFGLFNRDYILSTIKFSFESTELFHFDDFFRQTYTKEELFPL